MARNPFSRNGRSALPLPQGGAKAFYVVPSGTALLTEMQGMFPPDEDGVVRVHSTIDAAISAATASRGDIVYVAPGYSQTVATAGAIASDVAGVTVLGIGNGENRPVITFDGADATPSWTISGANTRIENFIFKCNEASLNHMLDITADDVSIVNCDFREGTATPLFFVVADTADNDSDRLTVKGCRFYCPTAGNGDAAIHIAKDMIGVRIEDCDIYGDWDLAGILLPAGGNACLDIAIRRCRVVNLLTNVAAISINGTTCTGEIADCRLGTDTKATALDNGSLRTYNVYWTDTTDQTIASPIFAEPDSTSNILGADDSDNGFASTNVADNRDGSVLERLESVIATLRDDVASNFIGVDDADNVAATTLVAANRDGSILERLEAIYAAQVDDVAANAIGIDDANNVFASSSVVANANGSLLERNEALQVAAAPSSNHPNYFTVTADMTSATWNTVAAHEIATVTGMVRMQIIVETTATVVTTGTNGTMALGFEGNTSAIFSATALDAAVTGDVWSAVYGSAATTVASGAEAQSSLTHAIFDVVVATGKDVGYTIATNAATTGTLTFHIWWTPLDSTGAVTAGAGGAL